MCVCDVCERVLLCVMCECMYVCVCVCVCICVLCAVCVCVCVCVCVYECVVCVCVVCVYCQLKDAIGVETIESIEQRYLWKALQIWSRNPNVLLLGQVFNQDQPHIWLKRHFSNTRSY